MEKIIVIVAIVALVAIVTTSGEWQKTAGQIKSNVIDLSKTVLGAGAAAIIILILKGVL